MSTVATLCAPLLTNRRRYNQGPPRRRMQRLLSCGVVWLLRRPFPVLAYFRRPSRKKENLRQMWQT